MSSSSSGVSILSMLLPLLLAAAIAAGAVTGSVDLAFLKNGKIQYAYTGTATVAGETTHLSADASLDKGVPFFQATKNGLAVQLKNGLFTCAEDGSVQYSQAVDGVVLEGIKEGVGYLADGGLKADLEKLLPYFCDIAGYNAFSLQLSYETDESGRAVTRFVAQTTPIQLLSAVQRWMMVRASDPQLKETISHLHLVNLPVVQIAALSMGSDLGTLLSGALLSAGDSMKYALTDGLYNGDILNIRLYLDGTLCQGALQYAYLQISDTVNSNDFYISAMYDRDQDGVSSLSAYMTLYGLQAAELTASWTEDGGVNVIAHCSIPSYFYNRNDTYAYKDFYGGDLSFQYEPKADGPKISLDVSAYSSRYSPSLTLRYESQTLDFLVIENPSYDYSSYQYANLSPYLRGIFSWDDSAYSLYAEGREFRLEGEGTYEASSGRFHQKGKFGLSLTSEYASPKEAFFNLEQTFTCAPDAYRLTQHLDAAARNGESLLVYDDSHALTVR